ncbi:hypothetical protein AVEN_96558-1 [Araneus ventricosus]|uniref:Uncharacterized protein n=1 Tax=Araneus ventricosus TaxID=182803 RepID=A0A4Y2H7A3_ARAVE|nr:hypothetical protein AVEN_96558-1 [Araneus ventricosus]
MKITWEDEMDETTRDKFLKSIKNISYIESIEIPGFLVLKMLNTGQYIFFCDARKCSDAAAAFLRIVTTNSVKGYLLQARKRVAPTGKG